MNSCEREREKIMKKFRNVIKEETFSISGKSPNEDVPNFLKRLEKFKQESEKVNIEIK